MLKKVTEVWDLEELEENDSPSSAANHDDGGHAPHLRDYWRSVRRYWLLVLSITLIGTLAATLYMARLPDIYEAEARVQVDLENNPAFGSSKGGSVIVSSPVNDPGYFNTQLEILTGSGLLRRVVKTLDLEHNQVFRRSRSEQDHSTTWQNIRRMVGLGANNTNHEQDQPAESVLIPGSVAPATRSDDLEEAKRLAPYVRSLQSALSVQPVKKSGQQSTETRLIDISFAHSDPQMSAKVVNAITNTFVLSNLERKTENNATAGDFLQQRVAELQTQIRHDEERLINYAKNHEILSLDPGQNTVAERLGGLNKQLMEAENERIMAEAVYRASLVPGAATALADSVDKQAGPVDKLGDLRQRRAQLLVESTEEWPEVKEVNSQIAVLEKQIQDARNHASSIVVANLETRYRQAMSREQTLRAAFDQQRGQMLAQNEAAINYRIIQQEIETNKTLLDGLLQRSKENEVVLNGTANNIHVVDHALVPESPIAPKRLRNVAVMSFFSLGFSIVLALFLAYLDDSMRSVDDVERMLGLPTLAVIPTVGGSRGSKLLPAATPRQKQFGEGQALLINEGVHSPLTETYRQLRTSLLLSTAGRPPKILLVASSEPNEGKTTIATNVALSLAQTGAKVLIIDADLRRPCLHSIFDVQNYRGLSTILSGEMSEEEVLATISQYETGKIHVLSAGLMPPNPAELLGSEHMRRLIATLSSSYNFIIIDSPPIAAFTDSVLISSMVDGVLLVIHGGKSSREIARRSQKMLQEVGARILGVVLNNVNLRSYDYHYQQTYYQQTYYKTPANADHSISGT